MRPSPASTKVNRVLSVSEVASQVKTCGLEFFTVRYPPLLALRETVVTVTGTEVVPATVSLVLVKRTELILQSDAPVLAMRMDWMPAVANPPVTETVTQSDQPLFGTEAAAKVFVPSPLWISSVAVCPEPLATRRSME